MFMLMSNWYIINTFMSNLGTATVLVFVICKLTYCIEFTKFNFFSFFDQWIFCIYYFLTMLLFW